LRGGERRKGKTRNFKRKRKGWPPFSRERMKKKEGKIATRAQGEGEEGLSEEEKKKEGSGLPETFCKKKAEHFTLLMCKGKKK